MLLGAGLSVQEMVKVMRYGAAQAALDKCGDTKAAAQALGVKPAYLGVLRRERPEVLEQIDG
jgi:hypothetical protein